MHIRSFRILFHCKNHETSVREFSNSLKNDFRDSFEKGYFMLFFILGMKNAFIHAIVILITLIERATGFGSRIFGGPDENRDNHLNE